MNNNLLKIVIILLIMPLMTLESQNVKGMAYYQTKRNIDLNLQGSELSDEQKNSIQARLKKQFERTYIMTFDIEASSYQLEESLENPTSNTGGMQMVMVGGPGSRGKLYKNSKTKNFADQQNLFGKEFLIKDHLETIEWKLEDESKVIGKYLCFKASSVREVENPRFPDESDEHVADSDSIPRMITQVVTAWYTTDIPVNHGPDRFWGLPGLILELNDGEDMQYLCNKIVMNTNDDIKEPSKGKVVSQKEFEVIRDKKMEEMRKNRGREGRNDDGNIRIRISG